MQSATDGRTDLQNGAHSQEQSLDGEDWRLNESREAGNGNEGHTGAKATLSESEERRPAGLKTHAHALTHTRICFSFDYIGLKSSRLSTSTTPGSSTVLRLHRLQWGRGAALPPVHAEML